MLKIQATLWAVALGSVLSACGNLKSSPDTQGQPAAAAAVDPTTQCLSAAPTLTRHPPGELYLSAAQCIEQDRLDDAAFLFGVAGSEGRFDTRRVADTTAHQVANFLGVIFTKHVGEASSARLSDHMRSKLDDLQARQAFCRRLKGLPPPSYYPQYMLGHGMQAFTSADTKDALIALPDAHKAWASAVNEYMDCVE